MGAFAGRWSPTHGPFALGQHGLEIISLLLLLPPEAMPPALPCLCPKVRSESDGVAGRKENGTGRGRHEPAAPNAPIGSTFS